MFVLIKFLIVLITLVKFQKKKKIRIIKGGKMMKDNITKRRILSVILAFALLARFLPMNLAKAADEPNYAEDEAKIKDFNGSERYRSTQLEQGGGPSTSFKNTDGEDEFIDGFRYRGLEPSGTSPDRTLWGFEIEFNRDKGQRTYTDFYFTNTGNLGALINTGNIPANDVGLNLSSKDGFKDTTYKANSELSITGSRAQRNFNLYADEEDLKYINSIENKSTVMAWQSNYLKDNPNGPLWATKGPSSVYGFTVNPWPNENDMLSLIKLNGSHNKKEFVQGQTITTDVTIENLDDNARERLVGQVYHPVTGEVVPGAKAYIDDNGKVHVKMPEGALKLDAGKYVVNENSIFAKDPDYKGLTHLDVRFFARPRTKAEFETIAGKYGTYTETGAGSETIKHKGEDVEIDKQGIDRYDHYNLIGDFKLNLDDTRYYDQDFKNDSGEKIDMSTTTKVTPGKTFTVSILDPTKPGGTQKTGDEMDDAYKNGQATGKLKEEFLVTANKAIAKELGISYDELMKEENKDKRWVIVGKGDNISNFTITAPKSAKAGDNLTLPVEYTYTNGSTDLHWFHFVVQESVLNKPEYEAQVDFPSEEQTSPVKITENEKKLSPVKYSIKEDFDYKDN